jgi:hypothetical protein
MHCGRQCREVLLADAGSTTPRNEGRARARSRHAALSRLVILQFDFFYLTVETVSQIRKLQAARIIP